MKTRIISGLVYTVLLVAILVVNIPIVDSIVVTLVSLIGIYEYNKAFKTIDKNVIPIVGYLSCIFFFVNGIIPFIQIEIAMPLLLIGLFLVAILSNLKYNVEDVSTTFLSIFLIPYMFNFLKLILSMNHGRLVILYVFLGAFASDIVAYFIGSKFGKRKLCKDISPKKTVEGSIAGILGVVVSYIVLTIVANSYYGLNLNILIIILLAVFVAIIGQFGDLAASAIKRFCKIKDFGSIMPGHGGILDRLDSVMFVAPIVYLFFKLFSGI